MSERVQRLKFQIRSAICAAVAILCCHGSAAAADATAAPAWPVYHGDSALSGTAGTTLADNLKVLWRFKAGAGVSVPPVAGGSMIFFVARNGHLYAISPQGQKIWERAVEREPVVTAGSAEANRKFVTPPLFVRGTVLTGSNDGWLYAVESATGKTRWKYKVGDSIKGSANWLEPEGDRGCRIVVISQWEGIVHCVDLDSGKRLWTSKLLDECDGAPGVGSDFVAFGSCDKGLHFLSASTGEDIGTVELGEDGYVAEGVAVSGNQVFAGTHGGLIVCADVRKKSAVWSNQVAKAEAFTTPAVTADRVVVGSMDGFAYCLDRADGKVVWSFKTDDSVLSPVIAGDKVVAVSGGTLYLLRLKDGGRIWAAQTGDIISSPAVIDGRVIVGTDDGFVVMYGAAK